MKRILISLAPAFTMNTFTAFAILIIIINADAKFFTSKISNKTYYVGEMDSSTWYEAYTHCGYRNMRLLTLTNDDEFWVIHDLLVHENLLNKDRVVRVWLGAIGNDRRFYWIGTGEPLTTVYWRDGNPSNGAGVENCIELWENTINDVTCTHKAGYVCEYRNESSALRIKTEPKKNNFILNFYSGK